jgi:hypothetical protein
MPPEAIRDPNYTLARIDKLVTTINPVFLDMLISQARSLAAGGHAGGDDPRVMTHWRRLGATLDQLRRTLDVIPMFSATLRQLGDPDAKADAKADAEAQAKALAALEDRPRMDIPDAAWEPDHAGPDALLYAGVMVNGVTCSARAYKVVERDGYQVSPSAKLTSELDQLHEITAADGHWQTIPVGDDKYVVVITPHC